MGQGIIKNLITWSDFDENFINANDLNYINVTANELVKAYVDIIQDLIQFMSDENIEKARQITRERLDKIIIRQEK